MAGGRCRSGTLENVIADDPTYADAYDVMGRAQFELGKFDEAFAAYRMAIQLTARIHWPTAELWHDGVLQRQSRRRRKSTAAHRVVRSGLQIFDCQSLVLTAFMPVRHRSGPASSAAPMTLPALLERDRMATYPQPGAQCGRHLEFLQHHHPQALEAMRNMLERIREPDFDFEAAANLAPLLAQLAKRAIQLEEVYSVIDQLALRFCSSRAMTELLIGSAKAHPEMPDRMRNSSAKVLKYAEYAMSLSMKVTRLRRSGSCTARRRDTEHQAGGIRAECAGPLQRKDR